MVRVELVATAFKMQAQAPAPAGDCGGPQVLAASSPEAVDADDPLIHLTRLVEMPAVPPAGAELYVAPSTYPLSVEHTVWHTEARAGEPHVQVYLSPIDLDALGDTTAAVAMLIGAGWDAST
jgi:hypothetical protein